MKDEGIILMGNGVSSIGEVNFTMLEPYFVRLEYHDDKWYFSNGTLVAFEIAGEFHVIKNYWSSTTERHLSLITDPKTLRESAAMFMENYIRLAKTDTIQYYAVECVYKDPERTMIYPQIFQSLTEAEEQIKKWIQDDARNYKDEDERSGFLYYHAIKV